MIFKTLDRYVIRELIRPTLFGLCIFGSLWLVNILIKTVEYYVTKGVSGTAVTLIFLYSIPKVVVIASPMACLLGALLAMGRLNNDSEIIAAKGCGISYFRLMMPVFFMGVVMSLLSFFFNDRVVPFTNHKLEVLMINEVALKKPVPKVAKDIFFNAGDTFRVFMRRYRTEEQVMEAVTCYQYERGSSSQGYPRVTEAEEAKLEENRWVFRRGTTYIYRPDGSLQQQIDFDEWIHPFSLNIGNPLDTSGPKRDPEAMNVQELWSFIRGQRERGRDTRAEEVDFWFKIAFPFANLFLILVGTPLAATDKRKGGGGVGKAIGIMFLYYVFLAVGKSLGKSGQLSPILAAWFPNLMMAVGALWLIRKSTR